MAADAYALVILADESVPLPTGSIPCVRMTPARAAAPLISCARPTTSSRCGSSRDRSESATLLFTYGKSWENALGLLDSSDSIRHDLTVILFPLRRL